MRIIVRELIAGAHQRRRPRRGDGRWLCSPSITTGKLALTAALALIVDLFVAAVGGILAPLILERLGRDPAVSSSIIVTFMTDF